MVIPSLDVSVARAGKSWQRGWNSHYEVLKSFLSPIVTVVQDEKAMLTAEKPAGSSPYPQNPVVKGLEWVPASIIIRRAKGSDNYPLSLGVMMVGSIPLMATDEGSIHSLKGGISMRLGNISGSPHNFRGENLRSSPTARSGVGASDPKVSGILMVDSVLYMLVRNTGNSQLVWSTDRRRIWI